MLRPKQHVFPTGRKSIPGCKVTAECRKALDEAGTIRVVEFGEMAVAREYLAQIERIPSVRRLIERWNVDRTKEEEVGWILARSRAHEEFAVRTVTDGMSCAFLRRNLTHIDFLPSAEEGQQQRQY